MQRAASQPPQPIAQTLQTAISPSEEVKDQEQNLALIDADDFQLASVSNTTDADVEPPKAEEDNSLQARVKHALAERENVLARKNIFVMLDDARADGDYETELGVLEIMATESTPAFSLEERMEFAVDALAVLAESEQPHREERTIRISQQLANYFDQMGLKAEATELRKQIVIHRRVLAEREG